MPLTAHRPTAVRLPSDVVLTARTLAGVARRFSARELGDLIDQLISELDERAPDPDLEPGADWEPDPELCAA